MVSAKNAQCGCALSILPGGIRHCRDHLDVAMTYHSIGKFYQQQEKFPEELS